MAYTTEQKLQRLIARRNPDKLSAIENAAHSGAFGLNPLPLPTDKQIESGNYKKGKFSLYGLRIAIEQPANSYRTGIDGNGNKWQSRLAANYGYILGTIGNDGDPVDCFVGEYPQADTVYIINQYVDGYFDEHKIMLCFPSEREARSAYQTSYAQGWNGLHSIVKASVNQFKKWLAHGSKQRPVTKTSLPIELNKMQTIQWDANGLPLNTDLSTILYHIRADEDGRGLLLDAVTTDEFNADYAADFIQEDYLDSLSVFYNKLSMTARLIANTMNKVGGDLQCTLTKADEENGIEANPLITKPYKKYGVLNVSLVFTLSDAQTITVVLHNPDSTPSKIQAHDMMVAWKWLLNKKDITAVVSPESGKDLTVQEIAKRIMQLAGKNSAAFTKANQNAADTMKAIDDLSTEINDLGMVLNAKQKELAVVQSDYEDWLVSKATAPVAPVTSDFMPTHTYHDTDLGEDVPVMRNEGGNWQSADGTEYLDIDSEVVAIGAVSNDPSLLQPVTPEPTQPTQTIDNPVTEYDLGSGKDVSIYSIGKSKKDIVKIRKIDGGYLTQVSSSGMRNLKTTPLSIPEILDWLADYLFVGGGTVSQVKEKLNLTSGDDVLGVSLANTGSIDPVAKSNIEAANISAAIKKKAIAYLSANPTSQRIEGIAPKSLKAVMESIKAALFAEIKALSPLFKEEADAAGDWINLEVNDAVLQVNISQNKDGTYPIMFRVFDDKNSPARYIFDSTKTLEDLESWGFALPFDLDVKAFVANVIKPVVDEFLAKQVGTPSLTPSADAKDEIMALTTDEVKALSNEDYEDKLLFLEEEHWDDEALLFAEKRNFVEQIVDQNVIEPEPTPEPMQTEPVGEPVIEPELPVEEPATNSFDADIEALRGETDYTVFNEKLDELAGKIEAAGLMEQYEPQLNELADLLTELLKKAA